MTAVIQEVRSGAHTGTVQVRLDLGSHEIALTYPADARLPFIPAISRWIERLEADNRDLEARLQAIRDDDPGKPMAGGYRRDDPPTSKAAAERDIGALGSKRRIVFDAIAAAGDYGATADELERATGIDYRGTLTPRIGELKRGGWVRRNGGTRPGYRGVEQAVNVLTAKGYERADADGIPTGSHDGDR